MATRNKLLSRDQTRALSLIFGDELALKIIAENLSKTLKKDLEFITENLEKIVSDVKSLEDRTSQFEQRNVYNSFYKSNGNPPKTLANNYYRGV